MCDLQSNRAEWSITQPSQPRSDRRLTAFYFNLDSHYILREQDRIIVLLTVSFITASLPKSGMPTVPYECHPATVSISVLAFDFTALG